MRCKLCGSENVKVIYNGVIKTGLLDGYTKEKWPVYQCQMCKAIWNEAQNKEDKGFYENGEYRERVDGDDQIQTFREKYDGQVLDKFNMTGTEIFRDKVVADIGCGGGCFLDFVSGVADTVIAVEPTKSYHKGLKERNYKVYSYAGEACKDYADKVDVITSFDVIEHVSEPKEFASDIYRLLKQGGKCIVGTPTDYPVLRQLLGERFDKFIFQVQHPWIFSEECLKMIFEEAGFKNISIEKKQKYGLGNLLHWLNEKEPRGHSTYDFVTPTMNAAYMAEMESMGNSEYLIVRREK